MKDAVRLNANEAIDQFILGCDASKWSHVYIGNDVVPYCDIENHRICSPVFPSMIDARMDTIVRGKNEHEAGHARLTPRGKDSSWSPLKSQLVNILEDLRIEKGIKALSPSIESDIDEMNRHFIDRQQTGFQTGKYSFLKPVNEALTAMHFTENGHAPQWTLSPEAKRYYDDAMPIFREWSNADCNTKSGFDQIEKIADRVIAALEKSRDEMNRQNGQDDSSQSQQSDQSGNGQQQDDDNGNQGNGNSQSGDGDNDGNSRSEGNENGNGNSHANGNDDSQADRSDSDDEGNGSLNGGLNGDAGEGDAKPENGKDSEDTDSQSDDRHGVNRRHKNPNGGLNVGRTIEDDFIENDNEAEAIREELRRIFEESRNVFGEYRPYTAEDELVHATEDKDAFDEAFNSIRGAASVLSSYLEQSLKTLSRCRVIDNRDKGSLSVQRNASTIAKSLSKNIFSKTIKGISLDTTVSILIDESGSIGYDTSREFRRIVIAFAEVLERLKIRFEVLGHTTKHAYHRPSNVNFTRCSGMRIFEHKNFNETYRSERYRLGSIGFNNCNIDGEALLTAFKRNVSQRSKRHVILVFSDGLPNDPACSNRMLYKNLTDTISLCRNNGVEVYAFGIGTMEPSKFYGDDNFVYLKSVDEMTSAFFHKTAEIITMGRRN